VALREADGLVKRVAVYALGAALAAAGLAWGFWLLKREPGPSLAQMAALRAERQRLQDRFLAQSEGMRELSLREAPAAGLLIGIPTEFSRTLAEQVVAGVFGRVTLRLRNLKVSKTDEVQARVLFAQRTLGQFVLDVSIPEVVGTLRPRQPQVTFDKNRLGVRLDVALLEGRGTALVQLRWDSRGLANAVCGDMSAARAMEGTVAPSQYTIQGSFALTADRGAILLKPRFREVALNVRVQPSQDAWVAVDSLIDQQSSLCRTALRRVDVKQKLQEMVDRGFTVKLPPQLFREIRLPAGVRQSLEMQGLALTLDIRPVGVVVTPLRLWYGANVEARRSKG
jgi:hypothetical protein